MEQAERLPETVFAEVDGGQQDLGERPVVVAVPRHRLEVGDRLLRAPLDVLEADELSEEGVQAADDVLRGADGEPRVPARGAERQEPVGVPLGRLGPEWPGTGRHVRC